MNMNLFGHDGQWLMVDCGITFDEPLTQGSRDVFRVVAADPTFITEQKEALAGIVITHAHEDHIGGLAHLWPRLKAPVYTTPFTAEVLRRKLAEVGLAGKVPIVEVLIDESFTIGSFNVSWIPITHSLPEPHALLLETPVGSIFHSADWKIDQRPGVGDAFEKWRFERLGEGAITAMTCDSTNALKAGHSLSEYECYQGLLKTVEATSNRVVVSCFASNIARLIAIGRVAQTTGRYLAIYGRSLQNMMGVARLTGHWPEDIEIIDNAHAGYLPKDEILAVATGSQGEPQAALARMANDTHRNLNLDAGDTIIFSAMIIPGNEVEVERLLRQFKARNISVILSENSEFPIHASGHPNKDELRQMYEWVKPQIAIPIHGEAEHIEANAKLAKSVGIAKCFTGQNGDLYQLAPQPMLKRGAIKAGRIIVRAE